MSRLTYRTIPCTALGFRRELLQHVCFEIANLEYEEYLGVYLPTCQKPTSMARESSRNSLPRSGTTSSSRRPTRTSRRCSCTSLQATAGMLRTQIRSGFRKSSHKSRAISSPSACGAYKKKSPSKISEPSPQTQIAGPFRSRRFFISSLP